MHPWDDQVQVVVIVIHRAYQRHPRPYDGDDAQED
jgi:hypothetical protein